MHPDDKIAWGLSMGKAVRNEKGEIVQLIGTVQDITKRRLIEDSLRESEEKFRSLAQNLPLIVSRFDRDLRHIYVSPEITKATGIDPSHYIGKTNRDLGMPEKNLAEWDQILNRVFKEGTSQEFEFTFSSPDGPHAFHSTLVPEFDEDGVVKTVLGINRDITESLNIAEALRASKEQLEEQNFLLENKNIALGELLDQVQQERARIQDQVLANVDRLLLPLVARMKEVGGKIEPASLDVIEENLRSLTSGFGEKISRKMLSLTKREIEIANLVRGGATSKEIAGFLGISIRGVDTHRRRIRKKLNLTNSGTNLATYLDLS